MIKNEMLDYEACGVTRYIAFVCLLQPVRTPLHPSHTAGTSNSRI
jgi:hypothetical protein